MTGHKVELYVPVLFPLNTPGWEGNIRRRSIAADGKSEMEMRDDSF